MKEIINSQTIDNLKKSRTIIIVSIVISIVIAIGLMVPLFLFATRSLKTLFIILLTLIASIEATFILYTLMVSLIPLSNYIKLSNATLSGNKYLTKGKVIGISEKVSHYKGVAIYEIRVKDLEEENKEYLFFVEQSYKSEFELNKTYSFITYQSVITSYEIL